MSGAILASRRGVLDQTSVPDPATSYRLLSPGTVTIAAGTTPGYNAYPGFCKMANGKRLVVARRATGHATNGGEAWKYVIESDDSVSSSAALTTLIIPKTNHMDSGLMTCDNGRVVCVYVINEGPAGGDAASRVAVIYSDDDAATWSAPAYIGASGLAGFSGPLPWAFLSSQPIQLSNNDLLLGAYGCDNDAGQLWYVRVAKSTDRGATWSDMGVTIKLPAAESAAEPNIIKLDDGRLYMTIRAGDLNPTAAGERTLGCWSNDDGVSWSTPVQVLAGANARPNVLQTPDGDILITNRGPSSGPDQGYYALSTNKGKSYTNLQQLAASRNRLVYGAAIYDGPADTDGALQSVVGQEVLGGANLYLYKWDKKSTSPAVSHASYDSTITSTTGVVAYWPLTDTSGQQVLDAVGSNHGTLVGDVRLQRPSSLAIDGVVLDAADDITNKYAFIKVPNNATLQLAAPLSIECWAAPSDVNGSALMVKGGPYNFRLELLASRLFFAVADDGGVLDNGPASILTAGDPHFFAVTWDGADVRFYIDGVLDSTRAYAGVVASTAADLWIGSAGNGTQADTLAGPMSAVALYNVQLDDATIAAHYAAA